MRILKQKDYSLLQWCKVRSEFRNLGARLSTVCNLTAKDNHILSFSLHLKILKLWFGFFVSGSNNAVLNVQWT